MDNELKRRYLYAVTRYLPQKMREEVERELDGLIEDMLTERCAGVSPTEKDLRVVLTELGTPEEVAMKYSGEEDRALISGVYFLLYKRVLRFVIPIVAVAVAIGNIVSTLFDQPAPAQQLLPLVVKLVGGTVGGALAGAFQAFAIVTIIFAIMDYKKVVPNEDGRSLRLPPVPKKSAQIKPFEPIFNMFWSVLVALILIGFPQIAGIWVEGTGWIPVFAVSVLRSFWILIVLWAVLGIVKEVVKLIEGRYTWRVALTMAVANVLILASSAVVLLNSRIMNPAFVSFLGRTATAAGAAGSPEIWTRLNLIVFAVICFGLLIETATAAYRAFTNQSS